MTDELTGLRTHRELSPAVSEGSPYAVLVDVDSLIWLNDQHGHEVVDAVLVQLAGTVVREAASVPGALVFRVGGDEFLIVLPGLTVDAAERCARGLVAAVHALAIPYRRRDQPQRTTLAVNAAVFRLTPSFVRESIGHHGLKGPGREWIEEHVYREKLRSGTVGVVVTL